MVSRMSSFTLLLASIIVLSGSVASSLTFDREGKHNHAFDRVRRQHDEDLSFVDEIGPQSAVDEGDPLYQKSMAAAHQIQTSLGLRDKANEFMIQQALYSCYKSEVMTRRRFFGRQVIQLFSLSRKFQSFLN